ncbi:hypothetical protein BS78_K302900 [Paspalum vaginatum]|uniref:Late embryogenesis abundant protein LEA-2 subgroup domain-containing protein n=1 Tax=Paspalum vaginatum TaxID=158149 RepID=A0A9W7XAA4_9POAL|nr:hypothetical protein BS78_K302900 [Paspalum vaginatum]
MDPAQPPCARDKSRKKQTARSEIRAILYVLLALALSPVVHYLCFDKPPKFSVHIVQAGLDDGDDAPAAATAINITLHASNKHGSTSVCYRQGEAVVRYSGFTLAWGRTRTFCVGAKDTRDVPVVAWADGVRLPKLMHDRMAAERRAGTAELEVNVKLFEEDDSLGAEPTWMWCKVVTTAGAAHPSDAATTPCSVFRPRVWASDFAPNWMLV